MNGPEEKKRQLRKMLAARRQSLTEDYLSAAGESIQDQILASAAYRNAESIFVYVSLPREPSTGRILSRALAEGKKVYVPKCTGKEMLAVRLRAGDPLVPGLFGIPEPENASETVPADQLDLILVPCLSASRDGRRLGHGGGYYDRFLKANPEKAVCLCFSRMICPDIPMTAEDVCIPQVISEKP